MKGHPSFCGFGKCPYLPHKRDWKFQVVGEPGAKEALGREGNSKEKFSGPGCLK